MREASYTPSMQGNPLTETAVVQIPCYGLDAEGRFLWLLVENGPVPNDLAPCPAGINETFTVTQDSPWQ